MIKKAFTCSLAFYLTFPNIDAGLCSSQNENLNTLADHHNHFLWNIEQQRDRSKDLNLSRTAALGLNKFFELSQIDSTQQTFKVSYHMPNDAKITIAINKRDVSGSVDLSIKECTWRTEHKNMTSPLVIIPSELEEVSRTSDINTFPLTPHKCKKDDDIALYTMSKAVNHMYDLQISYWKLETMKENLDTIEKTLDLIKGKSSYPLNQMHP